MGSFNIDDVTKFVPIRGTTNRRRVNKPSETSKNFNKIYRRESREDEQKQRTYEEVAKGKDNSAPIRKDLTAEELGEEKKSPAMVFDLHKSKKGKNDNGGDMASFKKYASNLRDESLSALNRYVSSKENLESLLGKSKESGFPGSTSQESESVQFAIEQPDLSYVNPLTQTGSQIGSSLTENVDKSAMRTNIQEIVDQIVDKLYTLKVQGRMDTTLTLKHPPLFEGAKITISEFDTAKGEFNIKFENLTQMAKELIDVRANQDALKLGLEQKGLTMHIVIATTYTEVKPIYAEGAARGARDDREGHPEEQHEKDQNQEGQQ